MWGIRSKLHGMSAKWESRKVISRASISIVFESHWLQYTGRFVTSFEYKTWSPFFHLIEAKPWALGPSHQLIAIADRGIGHSKLMICSIKKFQFVQGWKCVQTLNHSVIFEQRIGHKELNLQLAFPISAPNYQNSTISTSHAMFSKKGFGCKRCKGCINS